MPKTASEIGEILTAHKTAMRAEFMRLKLLDKKIRGQYTKTWKPEGADREYNDMQRKAFGPWLEFSRDAIAQGIRIDGYTNQQLWRDAWQANGMDGRQGGINKEAVGLGKSYLLVVPAETVQIDNEGNPLKVADNARVVMRPMSPLLAYAHYADPWDEFPEWTLYRVGPVKPVQFWDSRWLFIDDQALYRWDGSAPEPTDDMSIFEHGVVDGDGEPYCPVSRISNTLPTYGEPESSVERAIPVYERIVDATFTLEMVQRYGAFPQKYMSGGQVGVDANGRPLVRSSVDSLIHSTDAETKFGSFAAASLSDVVVAVDAHIKHLAAVCQVPPHYLLGAVVNMSAEGIAAAESGYFRNIGERKEAMGEGYELAMRIAGDILDVEINPNTDEMHFEDVSTRSLAQVTDAIIKLASLKYPLDSLFAMIPGVTQLDAVESARRAVQAQATAEASAAAIEAVKTPVQQELAAVAPTPVDPAGA